MTIYSMNELGDLYIKMLTETLLLRTITMDYQKQTLLRLVVPNN